jgi:hypothetical protein
VRGRDAATSQRCQTLSRPMNHEGALPEQGEGGDQKGKSVILENSAETCPQVAGTTPGTKSREGGGSCKISTVSKD